MKKKSEIHYRKLLCAYDYRQYDGAEIEELIQFVTAEDNDL